MSVSKHVRLKSVVRNATVKSDGSPCRFIGLEHVASGKGRLVDAELPVKAADDSLYHEPGDVLFGKLRPYLAKAFLAKDSGSSTGELVVMRPLGSIDSRFLLYVSLSAPFLDWAQQTTYGSKMPRTSWEELGEYRLWLPSLEEQQRIAKFLDTETSRVDSLIETQARLRGALFERRASLVNSLVLGSHHRSLKPSRLTWARSLPDHWHEVKVSFVAKMGSGHTPSRSHPEWWAECDIPWITTGEVSQIRDDRVETIYETREKISWLGLANSAAELHPAGTVVLSRTASAGFSAVMGSSMATSQDYVTWTCGPQLDPYYLLWCLRAMRTDLLQRLAMGSTHKTIYFPDLQSIRIPLPPIEEQREIVEQIRQENEKVDRLIDAIGDQLTLLAERRQALITAAVTGQLDVTTARSGVR